MQATITTLTLSCPGFEGERVTIVGPYRAPGAQPGEIVIRRADDTTMAVRPRDVAEQVEIATCGNCHRSWNDALPTGLTPVPAGRCPFEYEHEDEPEHVDNDGYPIHDA